MTQVLRAWGPAAAWAAVLFLLSAQPDLPLHGWWSRIPDKAAHLCLYAVLGAALGHARFHGARGVPHVVLLVVGCLFGVSDEWHQSFVPGRTPSAADWLADVVGIGIGYGLSWAIAKRLLGGPANDMTGTDE